MASPRRNGESRKLDLSFSTSSAILDDECDSEPGIRARNGGAPQANGKRGPHVIVVANEKGGVGKTTVAFHTCVALCHAGETVLAIDLDARQQSLGKVLANREGISRRLKIPFPQPRYSVLDHGTPAGLRQEINRLGSQCSFVIIDVAGSDSPIARHAIAMADTLVTPVNDSFIDIGVLGQFDAVSFHFKQLGRFAQLVHELRALQDVPMDWVVVPNRLRRLGSANEKRFADALDLVAPQAGFRILPGMGERVIYRDLFPYGLTLYDLKRIPEFARAQPVAKSEIETTLAGFRLPLTVHGD